MLFPFGLMILCGLMGLGGGVRDRVQSANTDLQTSSIQGS